MPSEVGGMLLRDLLVETKDGEWGKDQPFEDSREMFVIRGTDFPDVRLGDLSSVPIRHIAGKAADRKELQANDILIETAGGSKGRPTGRTILISDRLLSLASKPVTCASFARFMRVNTIFANPAYVFWFLQALYASGEIEQHQVQHSGIARFQYTKFASEIVVPLPPKEEQLSIAMTLGALDDKIALLRETNTTLEAIAQALFKSWFVDFDPVRAKVEGRDPEGVPPEVADMFPSEFEDSEMGMVPKGWRIASIKDVASNIQYGLTQSASNDPVGPRFLRITDIQGGKVEWNKVPFCQVTQKEFAKYKIMPHDVLVARTGASTGENIYLATAPESVFASYLVRFQFSERGMARLIGAFMRTSKYFDYVGSCRGGSAQPNASAQALAGARLVVPEPNVARQYAQLVGSMDDSIVANQEEINSLTELRDTLLPRLISGKLRIGTEDVVGAVS